MAPRRQADAVARELGAAQAEVLQVFWARGEKGASVPELLEAVNKAHARRGRPALAYSTVLTVAQRLHARGLLRRNPEGRGFRYWPTMTRDELLQSWSDELIDRILADFGDVGIARLDERLRGLDESQRERLRAIRRRG